MVVGVNGILLHLAMHHVVMLFKKQSVIVHVPHLRMEVASAMAQL